jgi:ferric-dicitrate binding protein FerR (iron transport regulator)
MSTDTPPLPPDLQDRLQDEPDDARADLEAVWAALDAAEAAANEGAAPDATWSSIVHELPELDATPDDGAETADPSQAEPSSRRRRRPARQPSRGMRRAAVGLALAVVLIVGGLWLWRQPVTVTVPSGQQRTATLPGGSTVDLNSGTTLSYRRGFQAWPFVDADRRAVRLDGEAFFEVADGARPFTVETENARVTVTGTQFNVRARAQNASTRETAVTVVEGRIRVAARDRPDQRVLLDKPGAVSRVTSSETSPTAPESVSVEHVLAWRNDGFAARAQPLSAVLSDLERRYDVRLRLHDSVEQARAPVSLYYPEPAELETILHDLCTARDLNYRPTSRGFEIFAASDAP